MSEAVQAWDDARVRELRTRLGLTQRELAEALGVRQQTVSDWETGVYRPRGASARMLRLVAEGRLHPYGGRPAENATATTRGDPPPAVPASRPPSRPRRRPPYRAD